MPVGWIRPMTSAPLAREKKGQTGRHNAGTKISRRDGACCVLPAFKAPPVETLQATSLPVILGKRYTSGYFFFLLAGPRTHNDMRHSWRVPGRVYESVGLGIGHGQHRCF